MDDESPLCEDGSQFNIDPNGVSEEDLYKELSPEVNITRADEYAVVTSQDSPHTDIIGITWYKATFLIVNAALGAGLLNFPQAFNETGGIVSGNLAHILFVIFALGSLLILALCGIEKNCKTYQEVVRHFCGPKWGMICSVCITIYCFVTCVTFIIIIGDQFDRAFASFFGHDFCYHWYMNRKFTMVLSSLFLVFPCCLKRIDGMEFMSYIGVASIFYLVIVIVVEMAGGTYSKGEVIIWDMHFLSFFNVVPTICFGYQCHVSSVPILSCLKKREKPVIVKACVSAILVCFLVYTVSANCGYLTFGSLVNSDILLDYEAKKLYVLLAVLLLAIKSWTTYPILLFCVREAVADLYLGLRGLSPTEAALSEPKRRKVIAVVLWLATIFFAVFIEGLNTVIRLLGSLAGVFILLFPGMCYLQMALMQRDWVGLPLGAKRVSQLCLASSYVVVGAFTFGLAFTLGIQELFSPREDVPVCVVASFTQLLYF